MNLSKIALISLFLLAAPKVYFELGANSDSSIRLVQNHLFNQLANGDSAYSVVPHGVLSFLQYPLKIGSNYSVFLIFNFSILLVLLHELLKKGPLIGALSFIIIYFLIGQRFIIFPCFLLLIFNFNIKGILWALLMVLIQFNVRLPMALIMASVWAIGAILIDKPLISRIMLIVLGAALMLVSFLWYPLLLGNGLEDVSSVMINNALLLKSSPNHLIALPFLVSFVVVFVQRKNISNNTYSGLVILVLTSILAYLYYLSRPGFGTFYVGYNITLSVLIVLMLHSGGRNVFDYSGVFSFFIFSYLVSTMVFGRSMKITKFDPTYAWKTMFESSNDEEHRVLFAANNSEGVTIFPWNQSLSGNFKKRISPYYISYCAVDSVFDVANWNSLGDTLLIHNANMQGGNLSKNDINGLYLGFSNGFLVSGIIRDFEVLVSSERYTTYVRKASKNSSSDFSYCYHSLGEFMKGISLKDSSNCDLIKLSDPEKLNRENLNMIMKLESGVQIIKPLNKGLLAKGIFLNRFLFNHNYKGSSQRIVAVRILKESDTL